MVRTGSSTDINFEEFSIANNNCLVFYYILKGKKSVFFISFSRVVEIDLETFWALFSHVCVFLKQRFILISYTECDQSIVTPEFEYNAYFL